MKKLYEEDQDPLLLREKIIGLGEHSIKKSYYPELQKRLVEIEQSNAEKKALIYAIPDTLLLMNREGMILEYIPDKILQGKITETNLSEKKIEEIFPENILNVFMANAKKVLDSGMIQQFIYSTGREKSKKHYETRAVASGDNEILFIIRDITKRVLMEEKLKFLATKDYLTGLYNRAYFEEKMKNIEEKSISNVGIIMCDVDGLKIINDTFGHQDGDVILKESASIISSCFSSKDIVARIGGDEFAVLLKGTEHDYIEKACAAISEKVISCNNNILNIEVGISVGYAFSSNFKGEIQKLFSEADSNMYRNKLLKSGSIRNALVVTMMKALEARDFITEGHAERMENISAIIAKKLSLSERQINDIRLLSQFHDIGKVGISDSILFKPGSLNNEEKIIMQRHSEIGNRIASASPELSHISHLILKHHERWDGSGYPLGLSGHDIPLESRIVAIADAYDAMSNDRPYRKAMKKEAIIKEFKINSGTQFDPELVSIFLSILANGELENM